MSKLRTDVLWRPLLCCLVLLLCAGCDSGDDDDDDDQDEDPQGQVRVFNAVPDSPTLRANLDGSSLANVSFGQSSSLSEVVPGTYEVDLSYTDTGGLSETILEDLEFTVNEDEDVSVIVTGPLEAPEAFLVELPQRDLVTPEAELHFVHAVTGQSRLDFYVTAPDAELIGSTPRATLGFGESSDLNTLDAGEYRLRVTAEGDAAVLFDSGVFDLAALTRRMLVAIDYFGPGGDGLRVVRVSPSSAATFVNEQFPSATRVVDLIYDLPAVDVHFGDTAAGPDLPALAYGTISGYLDLAAGTTAVVVTMEADPTAVLLETNAQLIPGEHRTLVVAGSQVSGDVRSRLVSDDRRRVATQAQLRVIHGSPSVGNVDFYLLSPEQPVSDGSARFSELTLLTNGVLGVEPGQYDLVFTPADAETILVGPERVTLDEGGLYTVILFDASGGGTPSQLLLVDDFAGG